MTSDPVPGVDDIVQRLTPAMAAEAAGLAARRCAALPGEPSAWYLHAAACSLLGRWEDVAASCRRVVALDAGHAEAWCNLGAALARLNQPGEAAQAYRQAVALNPGMTDAHLALGLLAQGSGDLDTAEHHLRAAVALDPRLVDAHGHLGGVLGARGRWAEALQSFEALLALEPAHLSALINYGAGLRAVGRLAEAAQAYRKALALHPESEQARYFVATLDGGTPPERAPASYVRQLFDDYAGRFDQHLVADLQYRIPEHLGRALCETLGPDAGNLDILDLGCGTGLAGQAVRGLARRLTGVDLSGQMIAQVRRKQLYDELHEAEIGQFLDQHASRYDVILAADVLIYLGDPAPLLRQVAARLKAGGLFGFSIETHEGAQAYVLRASGRYAHSPGRLRELAGAAGLQVVHVEHQTVRVEAGAPIPGCVLLLRKT